MQSSGIAANVFICPFCRETLSCFDHTMVKLKGKLSCETFTVTSTFTLSATLGCYGAIPADEIELFPGAVVEFSCPHCVRSLTSQIDSRLSSIRMIDGKSSKEMVVIFNRIFGEHSSFVIDIERGEVIGTYGEHSDLFSAQLRKNLNFFGC